MSRGRLVSGTLLLGLLALGAACERSASVDLEPASLVLRGGKLVTLDAQRPEAEAIAVRGHAIVAVGTNAEVASYVGESTEVIELAGRLVTPGFIEGHGHYMGLGGSKLILDLTAAESWDEIVSMVGDAVREAEPGDWIVGRGWHQEKWTAVPEPNVDGVPLHAGLSAVSPGNPVELQHASGHASFANAYAMELAGITTATPEPAGGEIVKDARGNPTGLLRETAQRLVSAKFEEARATRSAAAIEAEQRQMVEQAGQEALAHGVTSFQDAGAPFATIDLFRRMAVEGSLPVRLYVMVRGESNGEMEKRLADYRIIPEGNDFLAVRSIKRQIDGALGSHGAWLLEPYEDLTTSTGLTLETVEDIAQTAELAIEHGFQVNTHAIGDRANREVLDLYERAFEAHPDRTGLRWRIEHAQHIHPADVPRFAQLGVVASMQGIHCTSDAPWVLKRLGDGRAESGAYVWRSLLAAGAIVTNGTDVPVESIDPIASFYASVTRRTAEGTPFYPEQRMTREEALRSYTLSNAHAAFEEHLKGSLTAGKLADLVVLSKDIMTVPEEEILDARVDYTIVGGEVRFRR